MTPSGNRVMAKERETCAWCGEPGPFWIKLPSIPKPIQYHRECWTRVAVGSFAHQIGLCSCYGGTAEDPREMSKREAALIAADWFERYNQPASITCPRCGHRSHNPNDVTFRYCGACHLYHDDMGEVGDGWDRTGFPYT